MHIARRPAGLVPDTVLGFAACAANGPSWSPVSRGVVAGRGRAPCSSLAFNRIKTAESSEQKQLQETTITYPRKGNCKCALVMLCLWLVHCSRGRTLARVI